MLFANVLAMHTGKNRNNSNLTLTAAKKAIKNLAYKPVLANFCEIDGVKDFTSHDFDIDKDGNTIYYEGQVGCFTADPARIEDDKDHEDRKNVFARVAIPREYTDAAEIIERKGGTKVSVELGVNELSYSAKDKTLMLEDVEVLGLTCLGVDPDTGVQVQEGMEGARIQIEDFSADNFKFSKNELVDEITQAVMKQLGDNIAGNPALFSKEGGNKGVKFNQLLEKYGLSLEDIDFEYEGLSDEDLENEFAKRFDDGDDGQDDGQDDGDAKDDEEETPSDQDVADGVATMISALPENATLSDVDAVANARQSYDGLTSTQKELISSEVLAVLEAAEESINIARANSEDVGNVKRKRNDNELVYSVTINGETKSFSVSLIDKLNALSELVNSTYSEVDDTFYDIDAYDEDKYVIMHDYWHNKHYRQSYSVKKDVYSLKGDRVEVFAKWLTSDEISKLDSMKSTYSETLNKLVNYESEPDKMKILNSSDYEQISNIEEFIELKDINNHFNMTVDEVRNKADEILLAFAKGNKIDFSDNKGNISIGVKKFVDNKPNKTGRYGKLFKKII